MRFALALMLVAAGAVPAFAEDLETVANRAKITPAQAIKIAQGQHPGRVLELELEPRGAKPVYAIEFDDDRKVHVDAVSGEILAPTRKEAK